MKTKRALISVTDKELIKDFAKNLDKLGFEIYATKGTTKFLKDIGISSKTVEEYTNFPEILGGRVKTLNPKIFGGILCDRDKKDHLNQLKEHQILEFNLVCVDLYPVKKVIEEGANLDTVIENIDIGGISLIRASAKAFKDVTILIDPNDFSTVINEIKENGDTLLETRKRLATKAFKLSSSYDQIIFNYLEGKNPNKLDNASCNCSSEYLKLEKLKVLRYGENPHQKALYFDNNSSFIKEVLKGDISYNNILDLDGAANLCFGLSKIYKYVSIIVKHGSPSGVGISEKSIVDAFEKAWEVDPLSSFGGVLVCNEELDEEILSVMKGKFIELIVAPSFTLKFLENSESRKKLKILTIDKDKVLCLEKIYRSSCGGILEQTSDAWWEDSEFKILSKRKPTKEELAAAKLAWSVVAVTKSNAIVIGTKDRILGIGGGCVSRVDAANMAARKAKEFGIKNEVIAMASDAFLPFADSLHEALKVGASVIIEPGGSIRDNEIIEECDKNNLVLIFTNKRHFRH
ncbi:MAG: bifunctional phosphoribosylaminoimidazolecarboxamide formyltransferase/IMP cyclohydrolase [Candidatus Pacebacteria bacterium]|nr:bifunctional phosphoribosylaminoimidazolecarboxamide formyltransferase/IMP cyclohydrolase [Candidatus Paceibacterota bacterium]